MPIQCAFLHYVHCLSRQYEQKQARSFTVEVVKLCLLVTQIEWIFMVPLIESQLKELKFCETSSAFIAIILVSRASSHQCMMIQVYMTNAYAKNPPPLMHFGVLPHEHQVAPFI